MLAGLNRESTGPQYEFLSCRSGPWSIPARRRSCTSSGKRGYSKAWKSNLDRVRRQYYPVLKGLHAGDKVAAAGGFLIDAETRLNPAAASTYFGASGGPQSSGPPDAAGSHSAPERSRPRSSQTKPDSDTPKAEPESKPRSPRRTMRTSRTSSNCPRRTGSRPAQAFAPSPAPRWARWACR